MFELKVCRFELKLRRLGCSKDGRTEGARTGRRMKGRKEEPRW
jgi:hypothetical protein